MWNHIGIKQIFPNFQKNKKGTEAFFINVYYRQHSSWQGEVQWVRGKQKRYFRSVLELIHLIDSVISVNKPVKSMNGEVTRRTWDSGS